MNVVIMFHYNIQWDTLMHNLLYFHLPVNIDNRILHTFYLFEHKRSFKRI